MNCKKCGTNNEIGAVFCSSCGNKLIDETPTQTPVENVNIEPAPSVETTPVQTAEVNPTPTVDTTPNINPTPVVESTQNINPVVENKSNKNIVIIASIALAIVVVIGLVVFFTKGDNQSNNGLFNNVLNGGGSKKTLTIPKSFEKVEVESVKPASNFDNSYLYSVSNDDSKYGYIDKDGKVALDYVLDYASEFHGDYAEIKYKDEKNNKVHALINKNLDIITPSARYATIEYVSELNQWLIGGKLYDITMNQISPDNVKVTDNEKYYYTWESADRKTAGIMNSKGKITYTYTYQEGESYFSISADDVDDQLTQTYVVGNVENEKYAIINADDGTVVYDYTTNYISTEDDNIFEVCTKSDFDLIEYVIARDNKIIYRSSEDNEPGYNDEADLYTIRSSEPGRFYTYINPDGTFATTQDYVEFKHSAWERYVDYKFTYDNKKYGISLNGKQIVPNEYDKIYTFDMEIYNYLASLDKEYVILRKESQYSLYNLKTKKVDYTFNGSLERGLSYGFIEYQENDKYIVYSLITGKTMELTRSYVSLYADHFRIDENGGYAYYNHDMNKFYTEK